MKNLLLFFFTLCAVSATAQPVIQNFYPTAPGTMTTNLAACDTNGITAGAGGINQNWIYNLTYTGASNANSTYYVSASSTPFAAQFPTANLSTMRSDTTSGTTYSYYLSTPTLYRDLGSVQVNNGVEYYKVYSDPQDILFPIVYGSSQNDTYALHDTTVLTGYTSVEDEHGKINWDYDGFGTLSLNGHVYSNVARAHNIELDTLTYTYSGAVNATYHYWIRAENYFWMDASNSKIVFAIVMTDLTSDNGLLQHSKYVGAAPSTAGISTTGNNNPIELHLSCNPTHGESELTISGDRSAKTKVSILNAVGQLAYESYLERDETDCKHACLDTRALPAGVYFVRVETSDGWTATKRLVVE